MVCHFSRLLDTGGLESWAFVWSCGAVSTLTFCPLVIHTRENPGIGVEHMRAKGRRRWQGYGNQGGGGVSRGARCVPTAHHERQGVTGLRYAGPESGMIIDVER